MQEGVVCRRVYYDDHLDSRGRQEGRRGAGVGHLLAHNPRDESALLVVHHRRLRDEGGGVGVLFAAASTCTAGLGWVLEERYLKAGLFEPMEQVGVEGTVELALLGAHTAVARPSRVAHRSAHGRRMWCA